ncbi:MAG: polysaccharide biosynthesis protein, partial [Bacteroidales bacterium]|nr:polysaccharide biosynthesis protein [Bacteroidales bacterium]
GVDFVFHAAALKQVPSCEFFPMEAVRTNIIGCENVFDSALEQGVKNVIVLSTDKAVYPINAMGMTKALSEKVMIAKSRNLNGTGVVFCGTRYGNVMASRGSVIPLLVDQIKNGQPLTITDPKMTRFMMTLEDALDLVRIIGTRHGEKLYETLVNREEMVKAVDMGSYFRIPADTRDLNYGKYFTEGQSEVSAVEEYTSHNTTRLDVEGMKKLLMKLEMIKKDLV